MAQEGLPFDGEHSNSNGMRRLTGFPSLAAFIASDPDRTTAIFQRFDRLAARNLLYLQSELAELQAKQDEFDQEDFYERQTDDPSMLTKRCARNWEEFRSHGDTDQKQRQRKQLAMQIRATMKEYREAVLFEAQMALLPGPTKKTLEAFQTVFYNNSTTDRSFPVLGGHSAHIYDELRTLAALKKPEERDRLTIFVQNHLGFLFNKSSDGKVGYSSDRSVEIFVTWISILFAAVLLVGAVLALAFVESKISKIILICGFTSLFAISVGLLTSARRAEVFAATAAYVAVLVVFVSGDFAK